MRKIEVEPGLRLRFPDRGAEFDDGLEIGMVVARMGSAYPQILTVISRTALADLEGLARVMSYRVHVVAADQDKVTVEVERTSKPPRMRVIG